MRNLQLYSCVALLMVFGITNRCWGQAGSNPVPAEAPRPATASPAPPQSSSPGLRQHARPSKDDADLRRWLENMVVFHRFGAQEVTAATGLSATEVAAALTRFSLDVSKSTKPQRPGGSPLLVLPYPGGRHPRIGFLEGAIQPQRETKISVFTPWDESSYVVVDVPEAIWSNLGLTYLAHTHIPTVWDHQNISLPPLEWQHHADSVLTCERTLPNGIVFGTKVIPAPDAVHMEMWLTNGTPHKLTDLRVQNCVLLKGVPEFAQQNNDNKVNHDVYAACSSPDGQRWVITAFDPLFRTWANEQCPCLHSDPKFPDCEPGQTQYLRGWLSFYEGTDIHSELRRIEKTGWRTRPLTVAQDVTVRGQIVDADSGQPIPARLYIQGDNRQWYFAQSDSPDGSAVHYKKQPPHIPQSVEMHTTLSKHPFRVELPPGQYTFRVERGKETVPRIQQVNVGRQPLELSFPLRRWIDMSARGWYSGDTHVHRTVDELPNILLAEDLNVVFPLSYWVRKADVPPARGEASAGGSVRAKLIRVDQTHVIYPMNTEYEIFTVGQRRHTLGAVFVLNHQSPLQSPTPPVRPIADEARRQGALLDLDKHSWPWSLMLIPIMDVDLFELANNHMWQTEFGFHQWTREAVADWMQLEENEQGFTEWGWVDFGFKTYYALLNCGYRLRITAGTASGVHPVQLGFGRVYVHLPQGFRYDRWVAGLDAGRSFVSTGPMLEITFDGHDPGHTFQRDQTRSTTVRVQGTAHSRRPLERLEIVVNGQVTEQLPRANAVTSHGGFENRVDTGVVLDGSSWLAVRCFEQHPQRRVRFAHTNPVHIDIRGRPLPPRAEEVEYFITRMQEEIARNENVLSPEAMDEYREALRQFQSIGANAARDQGR